MKRAFAQHLGTALGAFRSLTGCARSVACSLPALRTNTLSARTQTLDLPCLINHTQFLLPSLSGLYPRADARQMRGCPQAPQLPQPASPRHSPTPGEKPGPQPRARLERIHRNCAVKSPFSKWRIPGIRNEELGFSGQVLESDIQACESLLGQSRSMVTTRDAC